MQIVHALMNGPMGFNELARAIGGCNPSTLAQRLDTLVKLDLLARRVEASSPPRTLYSLTLAGAALQPVVSPVSKPLRKIGVGGTPMMKSPCAAGPELKALSTAARVQV